MRSGRFRSGTSRTRRGSALAAVPPMRPRPRSSRLPPGARSETRSRADVGARRVWRAHRCRRLSPARTSSRGLGPGGAARGSRGRRCPARCRERQAASEDLGSRVAGSLSDPALPRPSGDDQICQSESDAIERQTGRKRTSEQLHGSVLPNQRARKPHRGRGCRRACGWPQPGTETLRERTRETYGIAEAARRRPQERQEGAIGRTSEEDDYKAFEADPFGSRSRGGQGRSPQARRIEGHRVRRWRDDRDGATTRGCAARCRGPLQDGQGPADPGGGAEALALVLRGSVFVPRPRGPRTAKAPAVHLEVDAPVEEAHTTTRQRHCRRATDCQSTFASLLGGGRTPPGPRWPG
jgi:hypothetical protein